MMSRSLRNACLLTLVVVAGCTTYMTKMRVEPSATRQLAWPELTRESRPWTRWWWMGSAVDKANLTQLLETYHEAGIGGVEVSPIYGVKGEEHRYIDYLSPAWMDMLAHTVAEAQRLGMGVDMIGGTGWPFGGPQVSAGDAASKLRLEFYSLGADGRLDKPLDKGTLQALMAFSDAGETLELTHKVDHSGKLDWAAPDGNWEFCAVFQEQTGQRVKRAAPGGAGLVLDHFSASALGQYLEPFDHAFAGYETRLARAFFNDSFEVYGANWTNRLFEEFQARRGYDLRTQLPALTGKGPGDIVARVRCDYRETIADLLLEEFTLPWAAWCRAQGSLARNQAHGSPGNLIDLYAAVDIPETEEFGRHGADILFAKFASSAAHLRGKRLVSSESATWLDEHFQVSLAQVKSSMDKFFLGGVNHVFFHGIPYSPPRCGMAGLAILCLDALRPDQQLLERPA